MRVIIVGNTGTKDAVIAAPFTNDQTPILFVKKDSIPVTVEQELMRLNPSEILVFGGTARVSNTVVIKLEEFATTTRIAGASVFGTAIEASRYLYPVEVPVEPPIEEPPVVEPPVVAPPIQGDIHYPSGNHGSIIITTSDVNITADPSATFLNIVLRNVDNVTLSGLNVLGSIASERTSYATNITVERCTAKGVYLYSPLWSANIDAPSGWRIMNNDLIDGGFGVGVFSDGPNYATIENTEIIGNKIGNCSVDGIRGSGFNGLTISGNEFYGIIENGKHNDGFQTVWGGKNLLFTRNYFHDNNCQPFFIKDGLVENIVLSENLSIRNRAGSATVLAQVWQVKNFEMFNNTFWDDSAFVLRDKSGVSSNMEMHHNVIQNFDPIEPGTYQNPAVLIEHDNVFGGGWRWVPGNMGPGSVHHPDPNFVDWQIDGYGITWSPADTVYGVQV